MSTKVSQSITINQPVEKVFAYITDYRNTTRWQPSIVESRSTVEEPAQVGARITEVRNFIGRKLESTYEITEVVPDRAMAFKSVAGPFPYKGSISFEPLSGTAANVTFAIEMEATGFFKLAEGMLAGGMKKELESDLALAKQQLES